MILVLNSYPNVYPNGVTASQDLSWPHIAASRRLRLIFSMTYCRKGPGFAGVSDATPSAIINR
jgi:hypothetical protein